MPSPSQSLSTLRPDLAASFEQYDLEASIAGYVGTKILTVVDVPTQAGNFGIIPIEQLLQTATTTRAPGAGYPRSRWTFKPGTYAVKENGMEETVDDREAAMYQNYFAAEQYAAIRARHRVLLNKEIRDITLLLNTSTFTNAAVAVSWKTVASSTPVADVEKAVQAVYAASGLMPNVIGMSWVDFRNVRQSASVIDRVKYSGIDDPKDITTNILAELFGVEEVLVAGSQKNTANQGQSASLSAIWTAGSIFVGHRSTSADFKMPCVGRTFHWSQDGSSMGGTVESYRDETVRGNVVRVRQDTDEQVLYAVSGYILTGANA